MLSGTWNYPLPLEFLDAISKLYGPSLQGLYWNDYPSTIFGKTTSASLEFLGSFSSLFVLDLCNYRGETIPKSSPAILPSVRNLITSNTQRSMAAATALRLPSLHNLTLKAHPEGAPTELLISFLEAHGASLVSIDLPSPFTESDTEPDASQFRRTATHINPDIFLQNKLCPNLASFTFPVTSPSMSADINHPLRRIGLRSVRAESLYPDKPTTTRGHLMSFTPDRYPNLEVIRTVGFLVDADTDALIKDVFIWWAEKFEKQGVDFLDGEGVLWEYTDSL
ncbi:hypothetical protein D9615_002270 [Tricholomella constricta]|uniref:Uncharacterized protein n=1 Tax=Tricholomella constricta TaxID=117010 RepID=A0A8H5HME8_9AGAR|nr:hypothetical protein D9615_002270 [Tricholomella constricta]